ncbi:MAG: hypothetical protein H7124_10130 [Phycisphaerales bacterium]|nr:hypothetical protein [Hyphomonadaceae bacterium]
MIDRAMTAVIATAAAAAAAVLVVFGAGFALYALLEPITGVAGAAALVALAAALALVIFALIVQQRARKREAEAALAAARLAEEHPLGLGDIARERPLVTLAITAVSGLIAARNPGLIRDLMQVVTRFGRR